MRNAPVVQTQLGLVIVDGAAGTEQTATIRPSLAFYNERFFAMDFPITRWRMAVSWWNDRVRGAITVCFPWRRLWAANDLLVPSRTVRALRVVSRWLVSVLTVALRSDSTATHVVRLRKVNDDGTSEDIISPGVGIPTAFFCLPERYGPRGMPELAFKLEPTQTLEVTVRFLRRAAWTAQCSGKCVRPPAPSDSVGNLSAILRALS